MKQFYLETGRDVVRAVESAIESMSLMSTSSTASVSTGGLGGADKAASAGSCSLSYLSILLGLVESQLVHPANLKPVSPNQHPHPHENEEHESLLQLKQQPDDSRQIEQPDRNDEEDGADEDFALPSPVSFSRIKFLAEQFRSLIRGSVDLSAFDTRNSQQIVARVAEVIWANLCSSTATAAAAADPLLQPPQDASAGIETNSGTSHASAHVQFLTSFLLERRLDSFGLTFAVYAALQVLFPRNFWRLFHLTLSEDHSWITCPQPLPPDSLQTAGQPASSALSRVEVTWHGKTDMRSCARMQQPDNWLYLKGNWVVCDSIPVAAVALISSLNPAINCNSDSLPLALLQKNILHSMYTKGLLTRYPMALGNLADLIELTNDVNLQRSCMSLYIESIACSVSHYRDHHIYPYLYLAGFCFRNKNWSESLFNWKKAAKVLSHYNYNPKEDEEAYKELQEIASDLIPFALNQLVSSDGLSEEHYRDLIEFYDGLCGWEEDSKWPVLHIGWSKSLVSCLNKFPPGIRSRISIRVPAEHTCTGSSDDEEVDDGVAPLKSREALVSPSDRGERREDETGSEDEAGKRGHRKRKNEEEIADIVQKCSQDPEFLVSNSIRRQENKQEHAAEEQPTDETKQPESAASPPPAVGVRISSAKMRELKDLLVKKEGKLNSSAIQLQITAQSSLFSSHHHHHHHLGSATSKPSKRSAISSSLLYPDSPAVTSSPSGSSSLTSRTPSPSGAVCGKRTRCGSSDSNLRQSIHKRICSRNADH